MVSTAQLFLAAQLSQNRPVSQPSRIYIDNINPFDWDAAYASTLEVEEAGREEVALHTYDFHPDDWIMVMAL
jgi:hypothetical protein